MSNIIDKILVSGVTYDLPSGGSGSTTVELTQAEYDALVSGGTVDPDTYYIITDATPQDMSQYWTSAQTNSAITQAVSGKQDTLVSGTNIKTINNESILGSGNIDIQGGGSIDVDSVLSTTSENPVQNKVITNTLNNLTKVSQNNDDGHVRWYNVRKHDNTVLFAINNFSINGRMPLSKQNGTDRNIDNFSLVETSAITSSVTSASTDSQVPSAKAVYDALQEGSGGITSGEVQSMIDESISGKADTSAVTESIDAAVSGKVDTTTFEIYSGNVETSLSGKQDTLISGTNIKTINNESLLGSGNIDIQGGGMTEDDELLLSTALTDLNDRKIDASEVKSNYQRKGDYVTTNTLNTRLAEYETALDEQNVEEVTAYALNDLNNRVTDNTTSLGGMKLVKITESEYAALTTKDENTLYIVVADPS